MRMKWALSFCLLAASMARAQQAPPVIFFTDLIYGSNSGGESVSGYAGAYVTVYGNFFGSTQGSSTITWNGSQCLRVVSWGATWRWYQKVVVQLGPGCAAATGNFVVTVNGHTSNGMPFTVGSGGIYFVSASGNDNNSGSFSSPWKTIPHAVQTVGSGAGNIVYVRAGTYGASEDGEGWGASLTMRPQWSAATAAAPDGLVAYPGETVQLGCESNSCPNYAIRCTDTDAWTVNNHGYWTFSNLVLRSSDNGGPLAIAGGSNPGANGYESRGWRLIALDVSSPTGGANAVTPFQIQSTSQVKIYGNWVHDVVLLATSRLDQAMYMSTDANNIDIGWNEIYNNKGRGGLQTHSSNLCYPSCSGDTTGFVLHDLAIHDNKIHHINEEGILVDTVDPSQGSGIRVYNNVIYDAGLDGNGDNMHHQLSGDFNQAKGIGKSPAPVWWYNNTVYASNGEAAYGNWWPDVHTGAQTLSSRVANNVFYVANPSTGYLHIENYSGASCGNSDTFSACGTNSGTKNLFYGDGAPIHPNLFTNNLNSDPLFANGPGFDFHLQQNSPAIGAGLQAITDFTGSYSVPAPTYDIDGRIRPNPPSLGAYEYGSGSSTSTKPNPPTNLSVTVQ